MAKQSNVVKFGDWDGAEDISYTTYFENARKVSSSEKANTNNPRDSHYITSKQEVLRKEEATRVKPEHKLVSQEDYQSNHDGRQRASGDSTPPRPAETSSDAAKRTARLNGAGVRSADHSPLHPLYQAKIAVKESAISSPSRERKGSYEGTHGLAPSTPGRSRLRSVPPGSETPDRGASVPKFGEWDETDPSSADGYSYIFNRVKEERHGTGGNASGTATDAHFSSLQRKHKSKKGKSCCCFPWGGN